MRRRLRHFFGIFSPIIIGVLLAIILLCYANQWDTVAVVTLIPIWIWSVIGCLLALLFAFLLKSKSCIVLFFLWLAAGLLISDESRHLGREFRVALTGEEEFVAKEDEKVYRIVSINCHGGKIDAARVFESHNPDIVFLQEAPKRAELKSLILEEFEGQGGVVSHGRNVIIARGRFSKPEIPEGSNRTFWTRLSMLDGTVFYLANVHLDRSIPRFDVWNRKSWGDFTENRIRNRTLLRHLMRFRVDPEIPVIAGGDFSTPAGDDIFRMLKKAGLKDASMSAPAGSGNTFPDQFSVLRLDQFWFSEEIVPLEIDAIRSEFTDHRVLVCDFVYRPSKKR